MYKYRVYTTTESEGDRDRVWVRTRRFLCDLVGLRLSESEQGGLLVDR